MKIEFYDKKTYKVLSDNEATCYFIMSDNKVYRDNGFGTESQAAYVTFENFIDEAPNVGWRLVNE